MSVKIVISGSISIRKLPRDIFSSLVKIISSNFEILVDNTCDTNNHFTDKNLYFQNSGGM